MNEQVEAAIRAHAVAEYPRECCGLIAVVDGEESYFPCINAAGSASLEHFVIAAHQYAEIEDQGKIVGVVHSHPDMAALPGAGDKTACEASGVTWHIVSVVNGEAREIYSWEPNGHQEPLVGRPYVFGVLDCYALVRDWYLRERNIELPHVERRDRFWERGEDLYAQHFEAAGFYEAGAPFKVGDLLVMRVPGERRKGVHKLVDNHGAIYIGNGRILHHMYGRLSTVEVFGGQYQRILTKVLRHKDMK